VSVLSETTSQGQQPRNWRDLRARLGSAAILVPAAAFCIWWGQGVYLAMIAAACAGMAWEAARMLGLAPKSWRGTLYVLWPVVAVLAAWRGEWPMAFVVGVAALLFGRALWALMVCIICAGVSLLWLRLMTAPAIASVAFVIAVVIASDSGAYLFGRIFGGPKLAPSVSPAKTWSGAIGGLVCAMVAGAICASCVAAPYAVGRVSWLLHAGLVAAVMGVASQSGDLAESALKRRCGVKDSSNLIPGHGGLLDRFDGLMAAAPVAAIFSLLAGRTAFWYVDPSSALSFLTGAR